MFVRELRRRPHSEGDARILTRRGAARKLERCVRWTIRGPVPIPHPQRAAMSFFNTLQQYVTSGVASLSISPRRFGSRENSTTSEDGTSTNSASGPPPLKVVQPQPQQNPLPLSPPLPPQPGSRSPALQRSPHHHHLLLQERSKSLKTGPSLQHQSRLSPRTGSLKEVPSLSITAAGPSSNGGNSSGGTSVSSVAAVSGSSSPLTLHHHHHGPLGSGTGKRREPIKVLPTFAQGDGTTRRTSWPQFAITGSGVQESDGSFFESYTALCWKQENRRLQVLREDDQQQDGQSHGNIDPGGSHRPATNTTTTGISPKEMEQLYVEVLYTIRHKLGAHSAKYPHHVKEDLVHYAQLAFGVGHEYHRKCHAIASEEKPPIVVLNVIVIEAEGLEAKDPNGFSDPYCMLGIQPGHHPQQCKIDHQQYQPSPSPPAAPPVSPLPPLDEQEQHHSGSSNNNDRRDSLISLVPIDRLKKHSSFRLSFKRKDHHGPSTSASSIPSSSAGVSVPAVNHQSGAPSPPSIAGGTAVGGNREQRDSLNGALPAKFIRATSVKNATLNPKWNEKFRFDIDDVCSDTLHLDIWDHDDEYSVLDAVSKLNEVRGVKGLGRFFKQIAQSARSGNQDDFLGCVNISLQEIPSTGVETWYKLGGRSQRSTIQGRIHLKLWLSTREDLGTSEEDNWTEIKQQENLHCIFIDFEVSRFKNGPSQWPGELSQAALTILHQHAIQGDVTVLQTHVVRWIAYARKLPDKDLHYSVLYRILNELDQHWNSEPLSREEEEALDQSFTAFVAHSLNSIRQLRFFFRHSNTSKLEYLLKCLMQLDGMRAFRRCCPFHKEIRGEIGSAVRKGALDWFNSEMARCVPHDNRPLSAHINGLTTLTNRIYADLTRAHQLYDDMFKTICSIPYFAIVHKSHMKMILHDYSNRLENIRSQFPAHSSSTSPDSGSTSTLVQDNASVVFELNIALQDLQKFQDHVQPEELPPTYHNTVALTCHECFRLVLEHWLVIARTKALNRVRSAVELDSFTNVEPYLKHSTSAIDTTSCFYQICDFWKQLAWPELTTSYPFVYSIVEMITASSIVYADLIFLRVQNTGFFNDDWKTAGLTEQIYVNINNLQHVKNALQTVPQTLQVPSIITAIDGSPSTLDIPRSPVTSRSRSGSLVSNSNHLLPSGGPLNNSSSTYDNSARQAFHALLDTVREHYEMKLLRIAGCLAEKMKGELKKNIFHLAWSPDSLPASEAATPLLDCLDNILLDLEPNLLPGAFHRCAVAIWEVLLIELWAQAEVSSGDKFCKFYDRLYGALQMLSNFLHADGKGLPMESLRCPTYQRVEEKISLHKTRTENLIDLYHLERLEQQSQLQIHGGCSAVESGRAPYGVLSIRVYFHHDSLSVEILSARDVIPLDPNGLSDPFVIIELLPRRLFPNCSEQQTSVKRKNLNPVFDECFEFPVTLEQCRQETAMLLFTVMDYDVLTANDFAGEAVLSLNTVPGVATIPQGLDTFHGLKQIDLVLMQQSNKHHPILSVLESRSWDRTAQDFVRKQKARIVSN